MIVEGIVSTLAPDGRPHFAPMGPTPLPGGGLLLRPYPTSATARHLLAARQGVFHVTDDAVLIARLILGEAASPATVPATAVEGRVLADCCRATEFRVTDVDDAGPRLRLTAVAARSRTLRDFVGFNRARHALLEAAIVASRFALTDAAELERDFPRWRLVIAKTGTPEEASTLDAIEAAWRRHRAGAA